MKVYNLCANNLAWRNRKARGKGILCPRSIKPLPKKLVLTAIIVCRCVTVSAYTGNGDSVAYYNSTSVFRWRQLVVPSALIAAGTYGVYNGWVRSVCRDIHDRASELRDGHYLHFDDYVQYAPVGSNVALGMFGVKSKHTLKERLLITAAAYAAMGVMVNGVKYTIREKRPASNSRNSFPSGHTATAFMGAELVREEYGGVYGVCAYTIAAGIAFLRIYNDRHWLNDVIAGAGVGIVSARIGYWTLPVTRKIFGLQPNNPKGLAVFPVADVSKSNYGVSVMLFL